MRASNRSALVTRVPMQVNTNRWEVWIPGRHTPGEHGDVVEQTSVSPEYFKTMGVRIVEGRAFTDDDRPETPRVAIVNETFARRVLAGAERDRQDAADRARRTARCSKSSASRPTTRW